MYSNFLWVVYLEPVSQVDAQNEVKVDCISNSSHYNSALGKCCSRLLQGQDIAI